MVTYLIHGMISVIRRDLPLQNTTAVAAAALVPSSVIWNTMEGVQCPCYGKHAHNLYWQLNNVREKGLSLPQYNLI